MEAVLVKRNFYVLDRNWERYGKQEFFQICNFLQVPSYVSCMTALAFHGVTTQVQRDWYENINNRRSIRMEAQGVFFLYHKVQPLHYFGFIKQDGFFIAAPEKALLDAAYLHCLGRYSLDWSSLSMDILDRQKLIALMGSFPEPVKLKIGKECGI